MTGRFLPLVLGGGLFCLIGLIVSFALLSRERKQTRLRAQSIERVVSYHRMARSDAAAERHRLDFARRGSGLLDGAARLLRYDYDHRTIYPAKPVVVVVLAIILATAAARAARLVIGPLSWVLVPPAAALLCRGFYGWCEDRHVAALFRQFPDALAMVVRAVRVGLPIQEALRVIARESAEPTAREFSVVIAQLSIGVPLDEALGELSGRNRLPEYRFFATALSLQAQTGGGLAETLENLADTIRKRLAAKLRGHALAAEARASAYILSALPVVTGVLLMLVDPLYMGVLFTDASGQKLLLAGIALLGVGAFTMRTLIRKSLS